MFLKPSGATFSWTASFNLSLGNFHRNHNNPYSYGTSCPAEIIIEIQILAAEKG